MLDITVKWILRADCELVSATLTQCMFRWVCLSLSVWVCLWGATAGCCASPAGTVLTTRRSLPGSGGQLDHTKTSWPPSGDAGCGGMVMSPVHPVWPKPSCKARWRGGGGEGRRGGQRGKLEDIHQRMHKNGVRQVLEGSGEQGNGGNWLRNHLWCPNDPRG